VLHKGGDNWEMELLLLSLKSNEIELLLSSKWHRQQFFPFVQGQDVCWMVRVVLSVVGRWPRTRERSAKSQSIFLKGHSICVGTIKG
jgi:hypothetical protein